MLTTKNVQNKLGLGIDKLNSLPNIDIEYLKDEKYSKKNET